MEPARVGAWVRRSEDRLGTIVVGRRTDLVELSGDPRSGPEGSEVTATICAGEDRYRADPAPHRTSADEHSGTAHAEGLPLETWNSC